MRSVTSNRVLPHWAIEELGQAAEAFDLKITVGQARHNLRQLKIVVKGDLGGFYLFVSMTEDWEDLSLLGEGDLWDIVKERYLECINE